MKKITEYLSYLPASNEPLSADVYFIHGHQFEYIFDVGANIDALKEIQEISKKKIFIISHFHKDHTENLSLMDKGELYGGKETIKHLGYGHIVDKNRRIMDGITLELIPLPSTHAKGCLALNVQREYTLLGDGIYATSKNNRIVYNAQLLYETIRTLKAIDTQYFVLSHEESPIYTKQEIISELTKYYLKKEKNNPYIDINKK